MRFGHRGAHMKEQRRIISIPKYCRLLLLGQGEVLCPSAASSSAGLLRALCGSSLGNTFQNFSKSSGILSCLLFQNLN